MIMGYAKVYIQDGELEKGGFWAKRKYNKILKKICDEKFKPLMDASCEYMTCNNDPPNVNNHLKLVLEDLSSPKWDFTALVVYDLDEFGNHDFVQDFINQVHEKGIAVYCVKTPAHRYTHVNTDYMKLANNS